MTIRRSRVFPRCTNLHAMRQQQRVVATVSLLVVLSLGSAVEAQTAILNGPYNASAWYTLTCDRVQHCSWYVRRGGASNPFHHVELGTKFVRKGPLPNDVKIFLTEDTKGTYRCTCRTNGQQRETLRKEVYFYSAAQRFKCPEKVAVVKGEPLNVSACYRSYLPEASMLSTMTLVEEATGKQTIGTLRNSCATYIVNVSQPGSYHLQVTSGEHGHINSATFNVTVQDPITNPTTVSTQRPTVAEWIPIAIAVPIVLVLIIVVFGAPLMSLLIYYCVLKWKERKIRNRDLEDPAPVGAHGNQQENNDAGNHAPIPVPDGPQLEGVDAPNVPPVVGAHDNQQENNNAGDHAPIPVPDGPQLEGVDAPNIPPAIGAHDNQQENDGVDDHAPIPVPDDAPLEGNGAGNLPPAVVDLDDHQDEDQGADLDLAVSVPDSNGFPNNALLVARYAAIPRPAEVDMLACAMEETLLPSQEELFRESQRQPLAEECTDRNNRCRPVDAIHRRDSTSSGDIQRISRPWLQHSASSPIRAMSEADWSCVGNQHPLRTDVSGGQSKCAEVFQLDA